MTSSNPNPIQTLLAKFDDDGGSDLFLHEGRPPAARVHGQVHRLAHPPITRAQLESIVQEAAGEAAYRQFLNTGDLDTGWSLPNGRRYRFNVSRQQGCLAVVARPVPSGAMVAEDLGIPSSVMESPSQRGSCWSQAPPARAIHHEMVYASHQPDRLNIITIEDPIEFVHNDAMARCPSARWAATQSFGAALRHVAAEPRCDRDRRASGCRDGGGHRGLAHRPPRLCQPAHHRRHQSVQRILNDFEHLRAQVSLTCPGAQGHREPAARATLRPQWACAGRRVLTVTPSAARLLREQRVEDLRDLMQSHRGPEMQTFNRALLELYRQQVVDFETGKGYATHPDEFALLARGMSTGVASLGTGNTSNLASSELDMKGLLSRAEELQSSDLHLAAGRPPIVRIDGELRAMSNQPLTDADVRMLLYSIMNGRQRSQYDLEREVDFAIAVDGGRRFRVNAYHQKGRMAAALRAIPNKPPDARTLGIPETILDLANRPQGLLLVVGPTGAGKSTTLACLLNRINRTRACRIITIEDPVEYVHESQTATVDQREVFADTKSFAAALKYILRQDPDVILVGEMRDLETISSALTAAETGHLVLATLHANDAVQAIDRIIDVFPAHQQTQARTMVASSLLAVVSQRLLQRREGRGRVAAFEVLLGTPAVRNQIRDEKLHQILSTMERSAREGMVTMDYAMKRLYESGDVRYEDALRYMQNSKLLSPPGTQRDPSSLPSRSSEAGGSEPRSSGTRPDAPKPSSGRRFPWNR